MTVPYPDAFLCSNLIYEREHLGMVSKCSFASVNYSNLEEPWNWEENPYLKDAKYMIMDFRSSQVRTTLILLYHKLLKKCNTFNPIICKSKKKTNLFCFLTTFFKTARFEHENEMRRKTLKHTQKFGIQPFCSGGWTRVVASYVWRLLRNWCNRSQVFRWTFVWPQPTFNTTVNTTSNYTEQLWDHLFPLLWLK